MKEVKMKQAASAQVSKVRKLASDVKPHGVFHVEHWRNGKCINAFDCNNMVTNEGKDALLNIMFHAATQITTWYLAPIDNQTGSGVQADDTYVAIGAAGNEWDETSEYDETLRQAFVEGPASSQTITNSASKAIFTMNATVTVEGIFCVGGGTAASTKADNAGGGTLWATALFAADVNLVDDDELKVTYSVSV
jgi:hypothetical protein